MEETIEQIVMTYSLIPDSEHGAHCTFCGQSAQASDYRAGNRIIQLCRSCAENPPGAVVATPETKKKKK